MSTHCLIPLLGKMLRVTELDSCGRPLDSGQYVATDGFVSIKLSAQVDDGTEIIVRKANGSLCVNEKMANSFKRFDVELHLCGVNPSLMAIMSNANPYSDGAGAGGDVIGFTIAEGEIKKWFSLELWTGLTGQACGDDVDEASGYIVLPFVTAGVLGDLEFTGDAAVDFSITGASTRGGNSWDVGPFDVVKDGTGAASPLPTALDPFDHLLMIDTALAPPPSACDPQPINSTIVATGATAGTPGTFTPAGAETPANVAALTGLTASPSSAWTTGQYVQTAVSGTSGQAYWNGTAWTAGKAS